MCDVLRCCILSFLSSVAKNLVCWSSVSNPRTICTIGFQKDWQCINLNKLPSFVPSRSSVYWGVAEHAYIVLVRRLAHACLIGLGPICTARAATAGWTHESLGLPSCNWAWPRDLGDWDMAQPSTNVLYILDSIDGWKGWLNWGDLPARLLAVIQEHLPHCLPWPRLLEHSLHGHHSAKWEEVDLLQGQVLRNPLSLRVGLWRHKQGAVCIQPWT